MYRVELWECEIQPLPLFILSHSKILHMKTDAPLFPIHNLKFLYFKDLIQEQGTLHLNRLKNHVNMLHLD